MPFFSGWTVNVLDLCCKLQQPMNEENKSTAEKKIIVMRVANENITCHVWDRKSILLRFVFCTIIDDIFLFFLHTHTARGLPPDLLDWTIDWSDGHKVCTSRYLRVMWLAICGLPKKKRLLLNCNAFFFSSHTGECVCVWTRLEENKTHLDDDASWSAKPSIIFECIIFYIAISIISFEWYMYIFYCIPHAYFTFYGALSVSHAPHISLERVNCTIFYTEFFLLKHHSWYRLYLIQN